MGTVFVIEHTAYEKLMKIKTNVKSMKNHSFCKPADGGQDVILRSTSPQWFTDWRDDNLEWPGPSLGHVAQLVGSL